MADEVMNQLAGVAAQIRSAQSNEPDNMQELLDEWSIHFPPSLGAIGAPKAVAATLEKQTLELQQLRNKIEVERLNHAQEITDIMKSLSIQLYASSEGVMSERRQQLLTYEQQHADFERQIQNMKAENDLIISNLKMSYDTKFSRAQDGHSQKVTEISKVAAKLKAELREVKAFNVSEKLEADRIRQSENEDYSNQIRKLQNQLLLVQGVIPTSDSLNSFRNDCLQCESESVVSLPFREEIIKKKKKSIKFTGEIAKAVKELKEVP